MNSIEAISGDTTGMVRPIADVKKKRVAVLFYRFGPYHHARLKAAGMRMSVTAIEFSNVDTTYAWEMVEGAEGFDRLTLFSGTSPGSMRPDRIVRRVREVLNQVQPQVVAIPGWFDRCSLAALQWCNLHGVPVVVMSETTAWDERRIWWKEKIKRRLVGMCSAGLVGGDAHAEYLEKLGLKRKQIFPGYDTVDNKYFETIAAKARIEEQSARIKRDLPKNFFLASARFIEKKNLARLIEAYARYRQSAEQSEIWDLVLLGDGPLNAILNAQLSSLNLHHFVHLPGFKQYDELPVYYGLAKVFIHASTTEQWGLVVNEAMAAGLPVLVSNRCGCAADLVQEGRNGFTFDPYDVRQLAELMRRVSTPRFRLSEFGSASLQIIEPLGTAAFGKGLEDAVSTALEGAPLSCSLFNQITLSALIRGIRTLPDEGGAKTPIGQATESLDRKANEFLVFRYQGRDVMAIPGRSKVALRAGLKKLLPFTPKRQLYRSCLSMAVRLGGTRLLAERRIGPLGKDFGVDFKALLTELEIRLKRPLSHTVVTWPSEPARRRLYVHLFDAKWNSIAFVKVAMRSIDCPRLAAQADSLRKLASLSFNKLRVHRLLLQGCHQGASYIVLEPLPPDARPLSLKEDWDTSILTAEFCGERRRLTMQEIMNLSWWKTYTDGLRPEHQGFHNQLTSLLPSGAEVCRGHGDLALSNMATDGSVIWLFDWESSHADAPVLTDAVGFFMSFSVGKAPNPKAYLAKFRARFLANDSQSQRLDVLLAIAFRHASGTSDAGRLMEMWQSGYN